MNREILNIVKRALIEESKNMCSECGSRSMVEGECSECGYMKEDMMEGSMCSECGGDIREGECMECGYMKENVYESKKLSKGQKYIAKQANPKDKIDANDFKKLRAKKSETKEGKKFPDLSGDGKVTRKDVLLGRGVKLNGKKKEAKENEECKECGSMYELYLDESTLEKFLFSENEIIEIIQSIVNEEKSKKSNKKSNDTKSSQSKSKKENDKYIDSVTKKMKDYLKGGSKGKYEMNPKHFPKGNGELEKMDKMAYVPSDTATEYIQNFTGAGLENLDWDEVHPNEKWVEKNIMGSSETGNNPEWANAIGTDVNKNRNKIRKNNLLAKVKRDAYQKDDQPVKYDRTGKDYGDTVDSLLKKYSKKKVKEETQKEENVISEIHLMKNLINYNKKTQ
jgi:hypothetical protein